MSGPRVLPAVSLAFLAGVLVSARPIFASPGTATEPAHRPGDTTAVAPASADVLAADAAEFRLNDTTLAHPFFEGRAPGTRGNQLAADLLEAHYKNLKLVPAFTDGLTGVPNSSYRQTFELGKTSRVLEAAASWKTTAGSVVDLTPGTDFNVLTYSGSGEASGPVVFGGYGINMGQDGYSSFPDGTDFAGKVVLILRYEPMNDQGRSRWGTENWTYQSQLESKISAVARLRAAAIVLCNPPGLDMDWVNEQRTRLKSGPLPAIETFESLTSATGPTNIPVIMLTTERAEALVKAADPRGRSLLDLRKLVDEKGEIIELPGATVSVKTVVERQPIQTSNIGAILKGRGALADEYVVLGAHYDHIGYGKFGSMDSSGTGKIHPGADDNASGTSGLMILAEKLSKAYAAAPANEPARSILFLSFTGEESGLNGSRHYTKNMITAKDKHYLMLNFDMIGRLRDTPPLEVSGVGTAVGLEEFVRPYLDSSGLKTVSKPGGGGPSDHASFNSVEIPVLFFFTGTHEQYHKPTDTPDLIDANGAAKVIDLGYRLALGAATRDGPFTYSTELQKGNAPKSDDPHAAQAKDSPGPVPVRIKFGVTPGNYGEENGGVLFDDVAEGWSAGKAGLKKGDRLTKWNGQEVPNVEMWMPFLSSAKPGDVVKVTVIRDGKELTIDVTMMARDSGGK